MSDRSTRRPRSMLLFAVLLLAAPALVGERGKSVAAEFKVHRESLDLNRPTRPRGSRYRGPIIDTHVHIFERRNRLDLADVAGQMESAGVRRMLLLPTPNEGRYQNRDENAAARRHFTRQGDGRFGRLCGSTYLTTWMHDASRDGYGEAELARRLNRLERDIRTGGCLGIGEIGPYHFEKHAGQWAIRYKLNFAPLVRLAQLAARLKVRLDLHAEPVAPDGQSYEDEVFGGIALLFQAAPGLKLILAHTGMTNAGNARALLTAFPNLMMNVKIVMPNRDLSWNNLGPIVSEDRELFEDWAKLMEDMADRFMIGSDARFGSKRYPPGKYERRIRHIRRLLGSLNADVAEMIAWRNAERLWPGR